MRASALALLALLYFAPRLPFLDKPLMGEEGIFAELFASHGADPSQAQMGRIKGEAIRQALGHPTGLYASIAGLGRLLEAPWKALLGEDCHPVWSLRLSFSLFQFVAWAALGCFIAPALWASPWLWLPLAVLMNAPMALGGSLYLQTDPSNGALLAGLLGLALAGTALRGADGLAQAGLAAACFLLGLGAKQEWSLGVAGGFALAWAWARWERAADSGEGKALALALAALALGNFMSWRFDPGNYEAGLGLMLRLGKSHNAISGSKRLLAGAMLMRGQFLLALGALWAALFWMQRRLPSAGLRFGLGASLALSLPYMATAWGTDYRYFIPPFMLAATLCLALLAKGRFFEGPKLRRGVLLASALLGLHAAFFWSDALLRDYSVTEQFFRKRGEYLAVYAAREAQARQGACVAAMASGLAWDRKDLDWLGDSFSPEDIQGISLAHGARACAR